MAWFRKRTEDRALTKGDVPATFFQDGFDSSPDWTGAPTPVTPDSALRIADAYACIRALSDAAASLPLIAYRRRGDERERLTTGRLADLLAAPAPATTQANLIGQMVCHLNSWGNCYVGKYRDAEGTVNQLGLLDPQYVQVELKRGEPLYTLTGPMGLQSEHGVEDILHIRAMSTDGLLGLSPIQQCKRALGLSKNLVDHASHFFEGHGVPNGFIIVPDAFANEAIDRFSEMWGYTRTGKPGWHRVAILGGDVSYQPMSVPMEDQQFLQQRELSATEIARIFRVPGWVVNAGTGDRSITYANVQQQAEHFVKFSLMPWLTLIEQAISGDPDLSPQSVFVEFLLDNLLRGDTKERYEVYEIGIRTGVLTVNEARRLENLPPREEPILTPPPAAVAATNGASNA
jgi:HK97 family phage portal protein